jgi:hypothetical protein
VLLHLGVPEPEVFPRISRGRGVRVPDTPAQVEWLAKYAREEKNALYKPLQGTRRKRP